MILALAIACAALALLLITWGVVARDGWACTLGVVLAIAAVGFARLDGVMSCSG
jgi:hypothetical protein